MSVKALALPALLASALVLAACQAPPATPDAAIGYSSTSFVVPFDLPDVSWVADTPSVEESHFVTWEGPTYAVRIINPVTVYPPGGGGETPPPDDYLGYLLGQTEYGVEFADRAELEIDGHPATRVTVTTTDPLDGSIGCPTQGMLADDCFGIQPEYTLRLVMIDVEGTPIVTWLRNEKGTRAEDLKASVDRFDALIAGMTFPDRAPTAAEEPDQAGPSALDGVWTTSFTEEELAASTLLYAADEVNDANWGDFTMTLDEGEGSSTQTNPEFETSGSFTYTLDGDVITLIQTNSEKFVMHWAVDDDTLTFTRDESIGVAPTPLVLKPWTRS